MSRSKLLARAALAAALALTRFAHARAVPANDTQWWQEVDVTTTLAPDWRVTASGFSRVSDELPNPALVGAGLGATYTSGHWTFGLGALYAALRLPASGARLDAELPYAAVTGAAELGGFTVSDRLRIEDVVGVPGNPWRYRNQVGLARRLGRDAGVPYVFATDEVFMDVDSERFTRNRLLAGVGVPVPLAAQASVEVAYLNQDNAAQRPGRISGVSLILKWNL